MKIIKYIFLIIIGSIIFGCANPKFYKEMQAVNVAHRNVNKTDKSILKKLRTELKHSNHIIYIHMGGYTALSSDRIDLVFDSDNDKYYRVTWSNKVPEITETTLANLRDCYELYILENFLTGNLEHLIYLGEHSGAAGISVMNCIYDINLSSNQKKEFSFGNFGFIDGKPIMPEEIIWD